MVSQFKKSVSIVLAMIDMPYSKMMGLDPISLMPVGQDKSRAVMDYLHRTGQYASVMEAVKGILARREEVQRLKESFVDDANEQLADNSARKWDYMFQSEKADISSILNTIDQTEMSHRVTCIRLALLAKDIDKSSDEIRWMLETGEEVVSKVEEMQQSRKLLKIQHAKFRKELLLRKQMVLRELNHQAAHSGDTEFISQVIDRAQKCLEWSKRQLASGNNSFSRKGLVDFYNEAVDVLVDLGVFKTPHYKSIGPVVNTTPVKDIPVEKSGLDWQEEVRLNFYGEMEETSFVC